MMNLVDFNEGSLHHLYSRLQSEKYSLTKRFRVIKNHELPELHRKLEVLGVLHQQDKRSREIVRDIVATELEAKSYREELQAIRKQVRQIKEVLGER